MRFLPVSDAHLDTPFAWARPPVARAGLDHAFPGHFHSPRAEPTFTYPGNPAPLTFGEHGERGAVLVDVHADGSVDRRWRVVATSQAHDVVLDVSDCASLQDIRAAAGALEAEHGWQRLQFRLDGKEPVELETALEARRAALPARLTAPRDSLVLRTPVEAR